MSFNYKIMGFTLLELMIAVAIVGVLGAIGYPLYTEQVIRGKRAEGRNMLVDSAAKMERYYSDCNTYPDDFAAANNCDNDEIRMDATSENGHYQLDITGVAGTMQNYTLTATPVTFVDDKCNILSLDQAGTRGHNGTASVTDCWGR